MYVKLFIKILYFLKIDQSHNLQEAALGFNRQGTELLKGIVG